MSHGVSPQGIGMTSARARERLVARLKQRGIRDLEVLERIRSVPRHLFVDEALASRAYEDTALPIGFGQTISQPWVVAAMTQALIEGRDLPLGRVLEVGTGCGYQSAVLAPFAEKIISIERIGALARRARLRLRELKCHHVSVRHADGMAGWPQLAPYDGILVAAAPERLPDALVAQLAEGGRLVMPVGREGAQRLVRVTRRDGRLRQERLGSVSFVPMLEGLAP
ncbi:MAG: protein-L-isoaspartate(D-aspartate) O-methyltransferase [Gammaproteobacteria bacterium]|nr:protein-L-isoaspartate(D-aspartate) O-methyltransferase [Gammaproteobacteria bacterium]